MAFFCYQFDSLSVNAVGSILSADATLTIAENGRLVVPNANQSTEGGGGSSLLSSAIRLQEIYGASLFPAHPITIREIRLRPSAIYGQSFTSTIVDLQINLSTTSTAPEPLTATFADNTGLDDTTVFHGAATVSSAFTGPVGGPNAFDIVIPLTTPFLYDPSVVSQK